MKQCCILICLRRSLSANVRVSFCHFVLSFMYLSWFRLSKWITFLVCTIACAFVLWLLTFGSEEAGALNTPGRIRDSGSDRILVISSDITKTISSVSSSDNLDSAAIVGRRTLGGEDLPDAISGASETPPERPPCTERFAELVGSQGSKYAL